MSSDSSPTPPLGSSSDSPSGSLGVARSSLIMASGTFVSRILGMIRSPILLTMVVGLNAPIANAFDIANVIPNILFTILAGGFINAVLVPAIVQATHRSDDGGAAYINKLLTLAIILIGSITLLLTLAAPFIVKIFAASLSHEWYGVAVYFAYWCIPQVFFYGLYAVIGQILNARESFGPYMWAPALNNVVAIIGLLILLALFGTPTVEETQTAAIWQGHRAAILGAFSTLGIASQALILIIPLRQLGIKFRFDFAWRGVGLGKTAKTSMWILSNALLMTLPTLLLTNVASGATQRALDSGIEADLAPGNAAYSTAFLITNLPISLVSISVATAVFTKMAISVASHNFDALRLQARTSIRVVTVFNILAAVLLIVFALPIARILVPSGSSNEIQSLALIIIPLSLAPLGTGISLIYEKVAFALEKTRAVFFMDLPGLLFLTCGYFACLYTDPRYTVTIMACVQSAGMIVRLLPLAWYINRKVPGIANKELASSFLKLLFVGSGVTALGILASHWLLPSAVTRTLGGALAVCFFGGIILSALFLIGLRIVRFPDTGKLLSFVTARFNRH